MKNLFLILGLGTAAAVGYVTFPTTNDTVAMPASPMYEWTMVAPPGSGTHQYEWTPGTYPSAVVPLVGLHGHLWMIGQKRSWTSDDGVHWTAFDKRDWGERISMIPLYFKDKLWVTGGMQYATNAFVNEIWTSEDGKTWELELGSAAWSPRKGHALVEFSGKMWLFGGETGVDEHRSPNAFANDIWSSDDGIEWKRVTENAPWKVRGNPRIIEFKEKLWLIGGQGLSDIWNSPDGKNWNKVTDEVPWKGRFDYGVAVFDGLIWVYGGREQDARIAHNDVWLSPDGKNWILQTREAPWTRRSGNFSVKYKDRLFLYGGKHTGHPDGFSGDIWTARKINH